MNNLLVRITESCGLDPATVRVAMARPANAAVGNGGYTLQPLHQLESRNYRQAVVPFWGSDNFPALTN